MKSLKELYKIGCGPSSSHTMGPEKASRLFKAEFPEVSRYRVTLYGSLALTGKGHLTDYIIVKTLKPAETEIIWKPLEEKPKHPNAMMMEALKGEEVIGSWTVYSVGGGIIEIEGQAGAAASRDVYPHKNFDEIKAYCKEENINLYEYAMRFEDADFMDHIKAVWEVMKAAVETGLQQEGILEGGLNIARKAKLIHEKYIPKETLSGREMRLVSAYAFAVNEVNAAAAQNVVTAPTCGACGTMPAVLYYIYKNRSNDYPESKILEGLIVGGIIGNVIKHNASVSGAEAGCQAEVGSACSMAAAARAHIYGYDTEIVEVAAEIAMEHNLGLTCDPAAGLVQVPCIERNAIAANKAINATRLAITLGASLQQVSFDEVVETMYQTGIDLQSKYRETSQGGLALHFMSEAEEKQL